MYVRNTLRRDSPPHTLRSSKQHQPFLFLVKGATLENFSLEILGTLDFKLLGVIEVSGTGLGIIVAGLLVALIVPKVIRARK